MNIDIGRAVTYPFEDRQWATKVGILLVLGLIPGLNVIVWGGYAISVARNVLRGEQYPLPAWDNWSDIAVRGLLSIVATLIYFLPALLVSCCLSVIFPLVSGRSFGGVYNAVECCSGAFFLGYTLIAYLLLNPGHARFAMTDKFASYFEIGARFRDFQENSQVFITLLVFQVVLSLVVVVVGGLLAITCIGPILVLTLAALTQGFMLGQSALALKARPSTRTRGA